RDISDGETPSEPFTFGQYRLQPLQPALEERVPFCPLGSLPCFCRHRQHPPRNTRELDRAHRCNEPHPGFGSATPISGHQLLTELAKVKQDRTALEDREITVRQPRHLPEGLIRKVFGPAATKWSARDTIRQSRFLQRPADANVANVAARVLGHP